MTIPSHSLARLAFGACCMPFFIQSLCLSETVAVAGLWWLILSDSISLSDPTIPPEKMRPLRLLIFVKPHWNWYRRAEAQNPWENCMPYYAIVRNRTRIGQREPNACIFCILFRMQLDGTSAQMEKSPWRAFWYLLHMQDDMFLCCTNLEFTLWFLQHVLWVSRWMSFLCSSVSHEVFLFLLSTEYHECPVLHKTGLSLKVDMWWHILGWSCMCQFDAFSRQFSHYDQSVCKLWWCSVSAWSRNQRHRSFMKL